MCQQDQQWVQPFMCLHLGRYSHPTDTMGQVVGLGCWRHLAPEMPVTTSAFESVSTAYDIQSIPP